MHLLIDSGSVICNREDMREQDRDETTDSSSSTHLLVLSEEGSSLLSDVFPLGCRCRVEEQIVLSSCERCAGPSCRETAHLNETSGPPVNTKPQYASFTLIRSLGLLKDFPHVYSFSSW